MVLKVEAFRLHPSFKKSLRKFASTDGCEIRMDSAFEQVISACATRPRAGQSGTWIVPPMISAYGALHRAGYAHSVETWVRGQLVGGLYCVAVGQSVFGESMFSRASEASKVALAALVCFCRHHSIKQIDCQQNTPHLASLGAREVSRAAFIEQITATQIRHPAEWNFDTLYWNELFHSDSPAT
jgi:leucyl/phenylalanyl-tRNA--protein transferase